MNHGVLSRHQRCARRSSMLGGALLSAVVLLGGCGGDGDSAGSSDLCDSYDEVAATAEEFSGVDPSETSADELKSRAEDFRDRLDELQEVAEGERIKAALSNLEDSLDSARDSAAEAGEKADERAAQAEDSLQEVSEKWARVQALVTDRCS